MSEFNNNQNLSNEPEQKPEATPESTQQTDGAQNSTEYAGKTYATYSYTTSPKTEKPKKKNGGKVAIAILATLLAVSLCCLAGFAGSLLGKSGNAGIGNSDTGTIDVTTQANDSSSSSVTSTTGSKVTLQIAGDGTGTTVTHQSVTTSADGSSMTRPEVVALVKDSVVEITTEQITTGSYFGQYVVSGAGSGVIISKEGYIVTNNHVISGASSIKVRLTDGSEYEATLIGTDSTADIAVIKIETTADLTVATIGNSDKLVVGEDVIAIGNPLGELGGTVTSGIISALNREIEVEGEQMTLLQTDAAVNPGNSGGGLFNMKGELIAIVDSKASGTDVEALGFAIPVNDAVDVIEQLIEYGYVRGRVALGISYIEIDNVWDASYYRVNSFGVYIMSSEYTDELKQGDRITSIDSTEVSSGSDIKAAIKDKVVGDTVTVTVVRSGKTKDVSVTLRESIPSGISVKSDSTTASSSAETNSIGTKN